MPAHGLAPQNLSSDKHVDVCADSEEDRGSTPLASTSLITSHLDPEAGPNRNGNGNKSAEVQRKRLRAEMLMRRIFLSIYL